MSSTPENLETELSPLLRVRNLNVDFESSQGLTHAVRDVSFDVEAGEIVGIVGESGSGKSVTCRAIMGLLPSTARVAGSVRLQGLELTGLDKQQYRGLRGPQLSMIFQNPASHLDPLMRVGQQVSEPLRHHRGVGAASARQAAVESLREVRLLPAEQQAENFPHQLSGGMKQRAMIAAAMACQPELLLADEPTTALDATVQAHILQLLKDLNTQKNLSLVLVSHDLAVIAQICDRVIVMRNGEVVEQGRTRDIVNSPRHAYTQQLIDSQPGRLERQEQGANRGRASKTGQPPLLQLNQLSVEFDLPGYRRNRLLPKTRKRSFRAVDDVSLELQQGECLGIVGESGSGKSTLVRAIMGLVKPASGEVSLQGQSILANAAEPRADFRRSVQMVFQNPFDSLNPKFSVWQTVAEPLRKHQLVKRDQLEERVLELLQLVELDPDLARRKPGQLSGGQCQRVGIARALAMKPRVLIADEITSALDVTIQAQIIALLNRLRAQENLSVIFISHDLALVRSFCDRAIVFRAGSIVEAGPVSEVLDRPSEAYTRTLLASAPIL